ncbi:MAG: UDP-N-acetylmuramoyl-L-alanine--D-glutamate ligase, partial [Coriobacteriaceae bacterium]|nr:UDP-N-acetylmuramoyl-L-alanine--D-glutamate ligase [Coriobacteriaceae bacterium]
LISEVEFAWRESTPSSRWIAITGTNGKSTTTALTAHILRSAGKAACAVGNIGDTCIDAVAQGRTDIYVAEVSSYQLASTTYFAPDVAVLLNITPDHLEWHKSHEEYVKAKMKIFNCLSLIPQSCAILNASDEGVWQAVNYLNAKTPEKDGFARVILGDFSGLDKRFEGATQTAYLRDKNMCFQAADQEFDFGSIDELRIKGMHNVVNALAAGISAVLQGVSAAEVAAALKTFEPLEHRIEPCGSVGGVACYNDSKATNSDSTLKALEAFGAGKTVVLLGGYDKGTDLTALVRGVEKSCKVAVCFGAAGPRFLEAFGAASVASFGAKNLKDAFDVALKQADFGDVILLSPACASFDEFENFEHRGRAFKELVADEARKRGA